MTTTKSINLLYDTPNWCPILSDKNIHNKYEEIHNKYEEIYKEIESGITFNEDDNKVCSTCRFHCQDYDECIIFGDLRVVFAGNIRHEKCLRLFNKKE